MNTRYYFPPETLANCSIPVSYSSTSLDSENPLTGNRNASPRVPPVSFLVRTVMRISRARWFSFLRRVFHYQNGSRSDLGSNPFNSSAWLALEFVIWLVQISAITVVLAISNKEKPVWPLRIWVIGYALGSLLSLPLLYWRCRHPYVSPGNGFGFSNIEQQRNNEESRSSYLMNKSRTFLELFFAICNLLGYNMNMGSVHRGATDDQISQLPKWRFKEIGDGPECNLAHGNENSECCICLAKYRDKEEVRQLPCSHLFHLRCVDQWLRIVSCCPLCKQELEK
ncbi:hypothetical protein AAC387_Pa05g1379 [Persea americana]